MQQKLTVRVTHNREIVNLRKNASYHAKRRLASDEKEGEYHEV